MNKISVKMCKKTAGSMRFIYNQALQRTEVRTLLCDKFDLASVSSNSRDLICVFLDVYCVLAVRILPLHCLIVSVIILDT